MITNFQRYRKLRGGYWATYTGMMWGRNWFRLLPSDFACAEEAWCSQCGLEISEERRSDRRTTCDVWCKILEKAKAERKTPPQTEGRDG